MLLSVIRETANGQQSSSNESPAQVFRPSLVPSVGGGPLGAIPSPFKAIHVAALDVQEANHLMALKSRKIALDKPTGISSQQEPHHPYQDVQRSSLRAEAEATRQALEEDNRSLKAELLASRRLLQERILGGKGR